MTSPVKLWHILQKEPYKVKRYPRILYKLISCIQCDFSFTTYGYNVIIVQRAHTLKSHKVNSQQPRLFPRQLSLSDGNHTRISSSFVEFKTGKAKVGRTMFSLCSSYGNHFTSCSHEVLQRHAGSVLSCSHKLLQTHCHAPSLH